MGEGYIPEIGIFWFIPSDPPKIIGASTSYECVDIIGGFRTLDKSHEEFWRYVGGQQPELAAYGYEYFPRGRVNWREQDDMFILLADATIIAARLHLKILQEWHLPENRLQIMTDLHYRRHSLTTLFPEK